MDQQQRTPLYSQYAKYGAKTIAFGGWDMPVQFEGIQKEHEAVRTRAGLFDVSHMGELLVKGPDALEFLQYVTTNDVAALETGQVQYTFLCNPDGGVIDDLLVYKFADDEYMLVVNAANTEKDDAWLHRQLEVWKNGAFLKNREFLKNGVAGASRDSLSDAVVGGVLEIGAVGEYDDLLKNAASGSDVTVENISADVALLALQGPAAERILQKVTDAPLYELAPFRFRRDVDVAGVKALVSRTGYTGEDGFECYVAASDAVLLWEQFMAAGEENGLVPVGLGARDTLRFEARLPLYGQELSAEISPYEAGLGMFVKLDKGDFIGREALAKQKQYGAPRKIVGIEMIDRGIPRTGYPVFAAGDRAIGQVTSGTQSPTLRTNVGLALIEREFAMLGNEVEVEIRGKRLRAQILKTPFYARERK